MASENFIISFAIENRNEILKIVLLKWNLNRINLWAQSFLYWLFAFNRFNQKLNNIFCYELRSLTWYLLLYWAIFIYISFCSPQEKEISLWFDGIIKLNEEKLIDSLIGS